MFLKENPINDELWIPVRRSLPCLHESHKFTIAELTPIYDIYRRTGLILPYIGHYFQYIGRA